MHKIEMAMILMPSRARIARQIPEIPTDLDHALRELNQAQDMINDALVYASNARLTLEDELEQQDDRRQQGKPEGESGDLLGEAEEGTARAAKRGRVERIDYSV
jgi:hypothetical protein